MLELLDSTTLASVGKPAPVRSAITSVVVHAVAFLFLLWWGFSSTVQRLPNHLSPLTLVAPTAAPRPPQPLPAQSKAATVVARRTPVRVFSSTLAAPRTIPKGTPQDAVIEAPPDAGVVSQMPESIPGGLLAGLPGGGLTEFAPVVATAPAPATVHEPPKPAEPAPVKRINVTSDVQAAQLLVRVQPEYPSAARTARVQGTVRLTAIISSEGKITSLKVLEGHPFLAPAALAAVEQWRYRPTVMNGRAVEVATEILVNFRLS